jgi:hypothetical protein
MVEAVWQVEWYESERGWGQAFLSSTTYETKEEAERAIQKHWKSQPDLNGQTPDYYIFPTEPKLVLKKEWDVT